MNNFVSPQRNLSCSDWLVFHWIKFHIPWLGSSNSHFSFDCLSIEYNTYPKPAMGYGIYPTPRFHISHSPQCGIYLRIVWLLDKLYYSISRKFVVFDWMTSSGEITISYVGGL